MASIAGLVSGGIGIMGALGGKSTADQVQLPPQFNMPNMGPAANNAFTGIGNLPATQFGQQFLPQYEQATQNLFNNPYAPQFQQGAGVAGQMGQQGAQSAFQQGQTQTGYGNSLAPYAGQIMNTAFDPQNALYARTLQQLQDQTRAGESARGIAMTPYGAGVEGNTLSNFNIDWANQQLARQAQGAGAASGLIGQAGTQIDKGQALMNTAPGLYGQASGMPYQAAQTIGQGQQGAISNLFQGGGQAQNLANLPIQDYLAYLGAGNQAGQVANQGGQLALNQANMGFNQNQTLGSNLGAGIQGIGNAASNAPSNWNWLSGGSSNPGYFPSNAWYNN